MRLRSFWPIATACAVLLVGCTPGAPDGAPGEASGDRPAQPKRLVVGARSGANQLGLADMAGSVTELVAAGLVRFTPPGEPQSFLAEEVPSIENNLLRVFPDGRMETTWRLKEGLKWHDGTPITAEDLVFTGRVAKDPQVPEFSKYDPLRVLLSVRAVDARTVVAEWKEPYIQAYLMFTWEVGLPIPRHLLEDTYLNKKEAFFLNSYWSHEFIHAGPYKVRELLPGERLVVDAFPDYVFGRPKVDQIEVRIIPDANTLIANVLGGEVLVTIGPNFTVGEAREAADRWPEGKLAAYPLQSLRAAIPQFINPDPPVQLDVRFRRALAHAFDRGELNELINQGLTGPPSAFMNPVGAPEFPDIKPSIVEYPYDPRRAGQLIEEIGYTRVGDTYRDAGGKNLSIQFWASSGGAEERAALFVVDSWRRVGVDAVADIRSSRGGRAEDANATRPGFMVRPGTLSMAEPRRLVWFHSSQLPTPENRFRGSNLMRYSNPELDGLIDRFFISLRPQERVEILKQVARLVTDQVVQIMLLHEVNAVLIGNLVQNVTPRTSHAQTWDVHLWDLK